MKHNLIKLVKTIENCKVLEIGVAQGNTMVSLLECNPSLTYLGIDPWYWSIELTRAPHGLKQLKSQDDIDTWYYGVLDKLKIYKNRGSVIRGFSKDIIPDIKEKFDVIHIDGDHTYEGCKWDLDNIKSLLKSDGVVVVDDVRTWPDVHQAWQEFKKENESIIVIP